MPLGRPKGLSAGVKWSELWQKRRKAPETSAGIVLARQEPR